MGCKDPVSYTHLDVYKRQIPICAKTEEDIADYSPEEKAEFLREMGIEATGLDNLIKASYHPVSYTHLDVYKRQVSGSICLCTVRRLPRRSLMI